MLLSSLVIPLGWPIYSIFIFWYKSLVRLAAIDSILSPLSWYGNQLLLLLDSWLWPCVVPLLCARVCVFLRAIVVGQPSLPLLLDRPSKRWLLFVSGVIDARAARRLEAELGEVGYMTGNFLVRLNLTVATTLRQDLTPKLSLETVS